MLHRPRPARLAETKALQPPAETDVFAEPSGLELAIELAHDVRSPLSAVVSLAELLQLEAFGPLTDAQRKQLRVMQAAAQGIAQLCGDIVDYGRTDTLGVNEANALFSPVDVLSHVRSIAQPFAARSGLMLRVFDDDVPEQWVGRRVALTRIVLNLTNHVMRYAASSVVEVNATLLGSQRLEFSVQEAFESGDARTMRATGASPTSGRHGLGLIICRRLLRAMGSSLRTETRPDGGTRLSFVLSHPAHT
jgi:signal transduction histidine kinase